MSFLYFLFSCASIPISNSAVRSKNANQSIVIICSFSISLFPKLPPFWSIFLSSSPPCKFFWQPSYKIGICWMIPEASCGRWVLYSCSARATDDTSVLPIAPSYISSPPMCWEAFTGFNWEFSLAHPRSVWSHCVPLRCHILLFFVYKFFVNFPVVVRFFLCVVLPLVVLRVVMFLLCYQQMVKISVYPDCEDASFSPYTLAVTLLHL